MVGALVALLGCFAPVPSRPALRVAWEPSLFLGSVAGGPAVVGLDALAVLVLVLALASSTARDGESLALTLWSAVGLILLMASDELLTFFLAMELMSTCLVLGVALGEGRGSAAAGLRALVRGSVASALFLFGLSLLHGLAGTTRLAGIGHALASGGEGSGTSGALGALLVLAGLGLKLGAIPLPGVGDEGAPAPLVAWAAMGSRLAVVVGLMKLLPVAVEAFGAGPGGVGLVALVAAATMTFGHSAALAQSDLARMLACSSIGQAGLLLVGVLASATSDQPATAAGSVLFGLAASTIPLAGAFALAGRFGTIDRLDGLGARSPVLAACAAVLTLSMAGVPPLAGFFGPWFVLRRAWEAAPPPPVDLPLAGRDQPDQRRGLGVLPGPGLAGDLLPASPGRPGAGGFGGDRRGDRGGGDRGGRARSGVLAGLPGVGRAGSVADLRGRADTDPAGRAGRPVATLTGPGFYDTTRPPPGPTSRSDGNPGTATTDRPVTAAKAREGPDGHRHACASTRTRPPRPAAPPMDPDRGAGRGGRRRLARHRDRRRRAGRAHRRL